METWISGTLNGQNNWCRSSLVSRIRWGVWISILKHFLFTVEVLPQAVLRWETKKNKINRSTKIFTLDCTSIPGAGLLPSTLQSTSSWSLLSWFAKFCLFCQLRSSAGRSGIGGWREMLRLPSISGDREKEDPRRRTERSAAAWEDFLTFQSSE